MVQSRFLLALSATGLLLLTACASADTALDNNTDDDMTTASSSSRAPVYLEEDGSSSDGVELTVGSSSSSAQAAASVPATSGTRTVTVTTSNWAFSPAVISAKKGEKVQLKLVGGEGIHGFAVPELGLNVRVEAGQTVTIDLPTDTAGTFGARCSIPCGEGHRDMQATVIITE